MSNNDEPELCKKCNVPLVWKSCYNCGGEEYTHHDCGDDTCACLNPVNNVECDICEGYGGFDICENCIAEIRGRDANG